MFLSRSIACFVCLAVSACLSGCAGGGANATRAGGELIVTEREPEKEPEGLPTAPRVTHAVFLDAVQSLAPDETRITDGEPGDGPDPSVLFTEAQRALMVETHEAYQREMTDYMRAHRAEMRELLPLLTPRGGSETPEERAERDLARERLAEIRGGTPTPDPHHDRLWRAMTEPQRLHVLASIADSRTTLPPRAEMRRGEREPRERAPQPPEPTRIEPEVVTGLGVEQRVFDGEAPITREERMERIRRRTAIAQERLARLQAEEAAAAEEAKRRAEDSSQKKDEKQPDDAESDSGESDDEQGGAG